MSLIKYDHEAVRNCAVNLVANDGGRYRLPKRTDNPFNLEDISPELDPDAASYFQTIIGILKWMTELGRTKIITKVSLLSSHVILPQEGY